MQNIKQIIRLILKNKKTTLSLLLSLSIGLTAYILISAKVTYNKSYDTYLDNYKNIYRIVSSAYTNNVLTISQPRTQRILGKTLEENYPGVERSGFLCGTIENHYKIGDNSFTNENGYYCSEGFLKIFSIQILKGASNGLLTKPNTVIISSSFAQKHFGNEDPVGQIILQYPSLSLEVEAVFKDFPRQSHVNPDFLISFHDNMHLPPPLKEDWGEFGFYTYLELYPNSDITKFENEITQFYKEFNNSFIKKSNTEFRFNLQAIEDIHINSHLKNEIRGNIRGDYLNILQLISFFILIISGFNYIYFSYSRITGNSKQFGIRKVLGAKNGSLWIQFLFESLLIHSIALIISFLTIGSTQQFLPEIVGSSLFNNQTVSFWISLFLVFLASSVLNPLLLLLMLVKKDPLALLSGKFDHFHHYISFRQLFIITQFTIVVFLISTIIGIDKQISFLKSRNIGISVENKLVIKKPSNLRRTSRRINNLDAFEQELSKLSGVREISISSNIPGDVLTFEFNASDQNNTSGVKTAILIADNHFIKSFQINIIEGNNFYSSQENHCIINSICLKQLGYENTREILGKKLYLQDESGMQNVEANVIGVCNDFNFTNSKETPNPVVLLDWTKEILWENYILSVAPNIGSKEIISQIEDHFYKTFPDYPFEYFWLDDYFNKQFDADKSISKSLKNFAIIAILLAVFSLFSVVLHVSISRTKEIGIRKINGAKQIDIIILLNQNFAKWIGIASIIAIPLSWYFLSNWLNSFAYKANISFWIFLVSAGTALIIGIVTVSLQSLKVANMNPVESIKYE